MSTADDPFTIDADRLWSNLMELKEIGGYDDEATGLRGVRRLALTEQDARGYALRSRCDLVCEGRESRVQLSQQTPV